MRRVTANGTILNYTTYTRDCIGNIASQVDSSGTTSFSYDPLYRLTSADYPATGNDESFVYDAVGNRTSQTLNGAVHVYEYYPGSNRLKAIHAGTLAGAIEKSFVYDDEGRLTSQAGAGAKTLVWDQKNRARQLASGTSTLGFAYDPMNYRIGRNGGTLGNRDYYLEGEHLEAEYSGANLQANYFRGLSTDELVAGFAYDASGNWVPAIYHHDTLMSVTGISAHDGATVQTASYSAFGDRTVAGSGASTNRLKYTGRELDADSGLYYYRARYYDPAIGRFVSEDPLRFAAGINFYAYAGNNPVNANDPSGNVAIADNLAAGAINVGLGVAITCLTSSCSDYSFTKGLVDFGIGFATNGLSALVAARRLSEIVALSPKAKGVLGETIGASEIAARGETIVAKQVSTRVEGAAPRFDFVARTEGGSLKCYECKLGPKAKPSTAQQVGLDAFESGGSGTFFGKAAREAEIDGLPTSTGELLHYFANGFAPPLADTLPLALSADLLFQGMSASGNAYGGGAAGGYLLYPNKTNNNMSQSVYRK